jgi:hypothetical protein
MSLVNVVVKRPSHVASIMAAAVAAGLWRWDHIRRRLMASGVRGRTVTASEPRRLFARAALFAAR